jgi:hypothetical protein
LIEPYSQPRDSGIRARRSRDFGIGKKARILGFGIRGLQSLVMQFDLGLRFTNQEKSDYLLIYLIKASQRLKIAKW